MDVNKLKQLFKNNFDAYSNTIDESIELLMREERFIKVVNNVLLKFSKTDFECSLKKLKKLFLIIKIL